MNSKKIDLKELLKEKKKIALGGHVRPDGDCIGSVMGLYLYLKQEYPHIQTDVYLEKIPETFRLIKGTDEVRSEVNNNETPYDLFICLDCADPDETWIFKFGLCKRKRDGLHRSSHQQRIVCRLELYCSGCKFYV